ncbi:MAG: restriction endonuclease subunit S [bacterium]|nr:restriction endonuclease subunit S [bacterium]
MTALALPKAFVVQWSQMDRWSVDSFRTIGWRWPAAVMRPLGEALKLRRDEVDRDLPKDEVPIIEKISFGGVITVTDADARRGYKGRLFWASPGELVYSKIRVKQGSLAVVPSEIEALAVSTEYPVYRIEPTIADGRYIELVVRSEPFKQLLDGLSHGGSTKTRIPPDEFARLVVPLPPLQTQRAIVAAFDRSRDEVARLRAEADKLEAEAEVEFLKALGLKPPAQTAPAKVFAMPWSEMKRWSVTYGQAIGTGTDLSHSKYPLGLLADHLVKIQYGTSEKANMSGRGLPVLRINNIKNGRIDTADLKHVSLAAKTANSLKLAVGDVVVIRTSGSRDLVGTCAPFEDDSEFVFASYLIRMRFNTSTMDPRFASHFLNCPLGRQQVDALSRHIMQNNINSEELRSIEIPIPPIHAQREIVQKIVKGRTNADELRAKAREREKDANAELEEMILGTRPVPK